MSARFAFELVFANSACVRGFPRYRRTHRTLQAAQRTAAAVHARLAATGRSRAAHPAIIYGPGCGRDGMTRP